MKGSGVNRIRIDLGSSAQEADPLLNVLRGQVGPLRRSVPGPHTLTFKITVLSVYKYVKKRVLHTRVAVR